MLDIVLDMKTVTMRELLHNSADIMRLVERGGTVRLTKRGRPVARLIPEPQSTPRKIKWPDFAARARAYSDGAVLTDEDVQRIKDAEERSFL